MVFVCIDSGLPLGLTIYFRSLPIGVHFDPRLVGSAERSNSGQSLLCFPFIVFLKIVSFGVTIAQREKLDHALSALQNPEHDANETSTRGRWDEYLSTLNVSWKDRSKVTNTS